MTERVLHLSDRCRIEGAKMSWLEKMLPQMIAKAKQVFGQRPFAPELVFDFEHVQAAIKIVEAAIAETKVSATDFGQERVREAVARAGAAALKGEKFSFIEDGVFSGNAAALWTTHMTFPMILRRSLFIAICSHVEHTLRQWCRWLHREWGLSKELGKKQSHESDLQNCVNYLPDVAGLQLAGYEQWPEWVQLDTYRVARNCLVHDGGIIPDRNLRKLKAASKLEVVEPGLISDEYMIHVLEDTCPDAASVAQRFFQRLSEIASKAPRAKNPAP